jgi:hypothetical protein
MGCAEIATIAPTIPPVSRLKQFTIIAGGGGSVGELD